MSSDTKEQVLIFLIHNMPTVWSEKDYRLLRQNRVMGAFVGPLPKFCQDKDNFGLPLRLMKVEAKLLIDKGIAKMVEFPSLEDLKSQLKIKYEIRENQVNEKQSEITNEERKAEIIKMAMKILEGKRRKIGNSSKTNDEIEEDLDLEYIINEEIDKVSKKDSKFVEICMEHPFLSDIPLRTVNWSYPETEEEKLLYSVYKDLWEKNYTLTTGIKFGGDYLAYQGDPDTFHASFIVKCLEHQKKINPNDMVAWIRVGTITKKTLVIASLDEDIVNYQSFHWPNDELKKIE